MEWHDFPLTQQFFCSPPPADVLICFARSEHWTPLSYAFENCSLPRQAMCESRSVSRHQLSFVDSPMIVNSLVQVVVECSSSGLERFVFTISLICPGMSAISSGPSPSLMSIKPVSC